MYMLQNTGYIYIVLIKRILNPYHCLLSWGVGGNVRDGIWVPSRSFLTTLNFCNQYCFHLHSANGQAVKRGTSLKYSLQPFIYMYNTQGHTSEFLPTPFVSWDPPPEILCTDYCSEFIFRL